jgi:hypothetical protein
MNDCQHCWHHTGRALTVYPPIHVHRCCRCNAERQLKPALDTCEHGVANPVSSVTMADLDRRLSRIEEQLERDADYEREQAEYD